METLLYAYYFTYLSMVGARRWAGRFESMQIPPSELAGVCGRFRRQLAGHQPLSHQRTGLRGPAPTQINNKRTPF